MQKSHQIVQQIKFDPYSHWTKSDWENFVKDIDQERFNLYEHYKFTLEQAAYFFPEICFCCKHSRAFGFLHNSTLLGILTHQAEKIKEMFFIRMVCDRILELQKQRSLNSEEITCLKFLVVNRKTQTISKSFYEKYVDLFLEDKQFVRYLYSYIKPYYSYNSEKSPNKLFQKAKMLKK